MTTVKINLRNNAITQYGEYPFVSFCKFMGRPLGAGPDGIFLLDGGDKDVFTVDTDERRVDAWFELPVSQLGQEYIKQGRRLYIGGEFSGDMQIQISTNCRTVKSITYDIKPRNKNLEQHTIQVPLSYQQKSEYWKFVVSNVRGADFSIDFIDGTFVRVNRRHGL